MNLADKLVIERAHMLLYAAVAFGLWQFSWIGKDMLQNSLGMIRTLFEVSYIAGSVGWAIWAFWYWKLDRAIRQSGVCLALNDELTSHNRLNAFKSGYFIMIFGLIVLVPAVNNFNLNAIYGIRAVATLGIIVPFILFALSEIKDDQGAN